MPDGNHVHLLLREGEEELATTMKRIGVSYATFYNWKYATTGHLFQDRFKSENVETEEYFLTVVRYIPQNPVKVGICGRFLSLKKRMFITNFDTGEPSPRLNFLTFSEWEHGGASGTQGRFLRL